MNNSITKVNIQQIEDLIAKLKSVSNSVNNNIKEYQKNLNMIESAGYLAGVAEASIILSCNKISETCSEFQDYATRLANSLSEVTKQTEQIETTEKNNITDIISQDPTKFTGIIGAAATGLLGTFDSAIGSFKTILGTSGSSNAATTLQNQIDKITNGTPIAPTTSSTTEKTDKTETEAAKTYNSTATSTTTEVNKENNTSTQGATNSSATTETKKEPEKATNSTTTSATTSDNSNIDISVYKNNPEKGFVVTTDNKTYELSSSDKELLYKIVASEAQKDSYDDSLAVTSVILNRADAGSTTPIKVATAPNQFSGYCDGYYKTATVTPQVKQAVDDALAGVRNNEYQYFVSNGSSASKYGNNMISEKGNRYRSTY